MKLFLSIIFVFSIILLQFCTQADDPALFPEREVVNKRSELFFAEISTGMPQLKDIPFFIKSKNFYTAYIKLSRVLSKTPYFIKVFSYFNENHIDLIEKFNIIEKKLNLDNYKLLKEEAELKDLEFYSLILFKLYNDYKENALSGSLAYKYWNIILDISHTLNKPKPSWENYAILQVTSKLFFFRKKENYKKKSIILKNKISEKSNGILLNYIIKQGDQ